MPGEITRTVWTCDLCGCEFPTLDQAQACEAGGVVGTGFEVGDLLIGKRSIEDLLIGWWRNDPTVRPLDEVVFIRVIGARLARSSGGGLSKTSHRLVYLLEDSFGELSEESSSNLKAWFLRTSVAQKADIVKLMLEKFRRINRLVLPDVTPVAEKTADEILALITVRQPDD